MAFGDMFKKKLGEAAQLVEKTFERPPPPAPRAPPAAEAARAGEQHEQEPVEHDETAAGLDDDAPLATEAGAFDWDQAAEDVHAVAAEIIARVAKEMRGTTFSGFAFDCDSGNRSLGIKLNDATNVIETEHNPVGDYSVGFELDDDPRISGLLQEVAARAEEAGSSRTPTAARFMNLICAVALRLEAEKAFSKLKLTKDFQLLVSDHDESLEDSLARMERVRNGEADEEPAGDDDDDDQEDADARPGESERDRRIRQALEGPRFHKFSDQDNTPQGQKAIELGIENKNGGRATYDYTQAAGADFDWPDLDPESLGNLEPWLCYGPEENGGWIDLNFIASGEERRAAAAYQTIGPITKEPFDRVDTPAFTAIERLLSLDDAALKQETQKLGLKIGKPYSPRDYFTGMRRDYEKIKAKSMGRAQAAVDVAMEHQKEQLKQAAQGKPGLFDPVDGITLEQYATVQVRRSKLSSPDDFVKLLAEYGMDEAKWAQVDAVFMARMADPSDPMATAAFATEYGKFYSAASTGQFAAGAKAGAGAMALDGSHRDIKAAKEPVSFERFVEIMTAQECWAVSGKDVNALLRKVFDMDAPDWSNLGAYWSQKMVADINMAMKLPELQAKYRPRYQQASADDDLEV